MENVRFEEIRKLCEELRSSHFCLSLMFSYLTLSWKPLKLELAGKVHFIDDLAAPSTWSMPTELFSAIVGLGFEGFLLDLLRFLPVDQLALVAELLVHNPVLSFGFVDHFEPPDAVSNWEMEAPWIILSQAISRWVVATADCSSITTSFSPDALATCLYNLGQFALRLSRGILSGTDQMPVPHSVFDAMCLEEEPGSGHNQVCTSEECAWCFELK